MATPPDRLRLFVALALEPEARARLAAWAGPAAAAEGWRPIAAADLHVTVVFLGATPAERVQAIGQAMTEAFAAVPPCVLRPAAPRRLGSVLATTLEPEDAAALEPLVAAQGELARRLDRVERQSWLPHVTLARPRGSRRLSVPALGSPPTAIRLAEVALFLSRPHASGSRYRPLVSLPLKLEHLPSDADGRRGSPPALPPDGGQPGRRPRADPRGRRQEGDA